MNRATFYAGYDEGVMAGRAASQAEMLDLINGLISNEVNSFLIESHVENPDLVEEMKYAHCVGVLNRLRKTIEKVV